MNLEEYKSDIIKVIDARYPREKINPNKLGKHKIPFEEALDKMRKEHPFQVIWNCRICNDKYVFKVDAGPKTEYSNSTLDYYVDCNTGETGFYEVEYIVLDWDLKKKRKKDDVRVWIDLSPEEAYHSNKETRKLRERHLSATLMQNERISDA